MENCLTFRLNWAVTQGIFSRTNKFDGNRFPILTPEDVVNQFKPPGFWLNVQVIVLNLHAQVPSLEDGWQGVYK